MSSLSTLTRQLVLLLLCAVVFVCSSARAQTITLTGGETFVNSEYGQWLGRVYREAFHRLGYQFVLAAYPSQRAIVLADNGEVDGQLERGHQFALEHPNLVRVEEPTNTQAYSAFASRPGLSIKGWDGLHATRYLVATRRGVGKSIENMARIVPPERLFYVETTEQGLRMLQAGRADLYLDYAPLVNETLATLGHDKQNSKFAAIYQAGVLEYTTHHAFLHRRHAALALRLAKALREMKRDGSFERLRYLPAQ